MLDEDRVFDVSKPSKVTPHATSKPVIVGHHPTTSDPMVKGDDELKPTKIAVFHDEPAEKVEPDTTHHDFVSEHHDIPLSSPPEDKKWDGTPEPEPKEDSFLTPPASPPEEPVPVAESKPEETAAPAIISDPEPQAKAVPPAPQEPENQPIEPLAPAHVEALRPSHVRRRSPMKWFLLIIVVLLIGGYLLIDSGKVGSGISLPFHIFKQKAKTAPTSTNNSQPQSAAVTVPAGFTEYKLDKTSISFAAPTVWGNPTSTSDPGYTKRGGSNQSDGTYAYIVDFANNKDVEIAVTSSKFLPAARSVQYYDYLQWCKGTADGKFYLGLLHFTTANKVDTPGTVACDQGPITDATQLDDTTIVELGIKNADGKLFGDLYTKNLNSPDLVVMRVKDGKSANSSQIKQLLSTVKSPSTAAQTQ